MKTKVMNDIENQDYIISKKTSLKKTPEGLIYAARILITKNIKYLKDVELLSFYEYEKIVLMFDSDDEYKKNKELILESKRALSKKNIQLLISIKNTKKKDISVYDFENKNEKEMIKIIKNAHLIYNLEVNDKRDKLNVPFSNFNQVYAKEFAMRNIILGISIKSISEPRLIPRIRQNLKLARKYKIPTILSSFDENMIFGWYEAMQMLRVIVSR